MPKWINCGKVQGENGEPFLNIVIGKGYSTYNDMIAEHPTGVTGEAYAVNTDIWIWSEKENDWIGIKDALSVSPINASPATATENGNIGLVQLAADNIDGANRALAMTAAATEAAIARRFAICTIAAATVAKTVSIPGFVRRTGTMVGIKFTLGSSATNPTLNVENTGAASIIYRGATINNTSVSILANALILFQFNGAQWEIISIPGPPGQTVNCNCNCCGGSN